MKKTIFFLYALSWVVLSCTKEKTDYEKEIAIEAPTYHEFGEATAIQSGDYTISIEALNGTFYQGYNEIRVHVRHRQNHVVAPAEALKFLPIKSDAQGKHTSCPHRYELNMQQETDYFVGYVVFTEKSTADQNWELHMRCTIDGTTHTVTLPISVQEQPNKNLAMSSFIGRDGEEYIIALVAPQQPHVGENELIAGLYRLEGLPLPSTEDFPETPSLPYTEIQGYTLLLDPRMPEPSMGNHSSPNNEDLTQGSDGLYHGVVNYTMTGNWTLNFILQNQQGRILKGTTVPTDFTPGVEGVKSELHIDILF